MAVTTIEGPDTTTLTLGAAYKTATDHIEGSNCDYVTIHIDKDAAIVGDYQFTITTGGNGATPHFAEPIILHKQRSEGGSQLAAGVHKTFRPGRAASWTLDAKADSGTPLIHVETGLLR